MVATIGGLVVARTLITTGPLSPARPVALDAPHFVDEATGAGVDHTYGGDYPYVVGGGVATFDCDDDGAPDLYLAGGAEPAALYRNRSELGGALRFERVAVPLTDMSGVSGAYPIDIDGDRHTDLAVLRLGEDVILRGLGECRFERANETLGIDDAESWTVGFSATWELPSAPLPTLAFGDYLVLDDQGKWTGACADDRLVRPAASGGRYAAPIALRPSWCTLSMLFSDWDRSGRRDLRVSNDRHYYRDGEDQLWRIEPGQPPRSYTREEGWAATADLGHGHREPGRDRRSLPRGLPDQPGGQQAPVARGWAERAALRGHRLATGRDRARPVRGRGEPGLHGMASGLRGRQQRWAYRPVREQGQRRRTSSTTP